VPNLFAELPIGTAVSDLELAAGLVWVGLGSGLRADQGEVARRGSATAMPADAAAGRRMDDQARNDKQG
jgi:hypothetical protein